MPGSFLLGSWLFLVLESHVHKNPGIPGLKSLDLSAVNELSEEGGNMDL